MLTAAATYDIAGGWNVALAAFSLVLVTGGITAMIKKSMRPAQALTILGTAAVVGAIALLASGFPIAPVKIAIIATCTVGGIAIAAAVITSPAAKPHER